MSDAEWSDYVEIGSNMCKLKPTLELRWLIGASASHHSQILQQKWEAIGTLPDGYDMTVERWRDIPIVHDPSS